LELTTDRHKASQGLFATAELLVLFRTDETYIEFGWIIRESAQDTNAVAFPTKPA